MYARARHGLWHGLRALGVRPGDEALVPAYHHGSEVEVFERTGLVCRFYEGGPSLEPDEAELEGLLTDRSRVLHLIHYLGFPQETGKWRGWCHRRGLLLIEDAAQSWLAHVAGRPVGSVGDLSIFSLYKTVGLPDGGAAVGPRPLPRPGRSGVTHSARIHASWLRRSLGLPRAAGGGRLYDPQEDFAVGDPATPASAATRFLVARVAAPRVAARRRENFRILQGLLGHLVPSPFGRLGDGSSPFVFPIEVENKPRLLRRLAERGIDALNLWSVPHPTLPASRFPRVVHLRARLVGLPVHQGLKEDDLDRIASSVLAVQALGS